jgi:hypothetical protein
MRCIEAVLGALVACAVATGAAGCRMGPHLEGPQVYPSEFGAPMAKVGALHEADIGPWEKVVPKLTWPATVAVLQLHRDTRYVALGQDEWDKSVGALPGVRQVNILDGLGIGDEELHAQGSRADLHRAPAPAPVEWGKNTLFVRERWAASAAGASFVFVFATKVASDTYWNYWWTSYALLVPTFFVPAQEQTVQAVSKGFLVDVKTGRILETAGTVATRSRHANPILRTEPIFQLEQEAVREAELRMIEQVAEKLKAMRNAA